MKTTAISAGVAAVCLLLASPAAAQSEPPAAPPRFRVEPLTDGAVVAIGGGFAGVLDLVSGTGEIRPQPISPTFETKSLLWIDRSAVTQHVDSNAATYSNIG